MKLCYKFLIIFALFALSVLILEYSGLDVMINNHFYNSLTREWLMNEQSGIVHFWVYHLPKKLIILFGVLVLIRYIYTVYKKNIDSRYLKVAIFFGILPLLVVFFKNLTNTECPFHLKMYGGHKEYIRLLNQCTIECNGRCFPAGHSATGFVLIALGFFAKTQKRKLLYIGVGVFAGHFFGAYQMLRGAHFLSHTMATMWIGLLLYLIIDWVFSRFETACSSSQVKLK